MVLPAVGTAWHAWSSATAGWPSSGGMPADRGAFFTFYKEATEVIDL
jgi:hypothetical protein